MQNKALQAFQVPKDVYNAIQKAAKATGVNFTYLMEKAAVESSFDPNAKARTSSATGLFQFIESTWLKMVKEHGPKYGLEKYADKISDNGRVSDHKTRKAILNLRKDPEISAYMAAEFATDNYNVLKDRVGGHVGSTELYMAHFLGANGASAFLNAMKKSPNMAAADLFPDAARTNRTVFYDSRSGAPRSMKQVYAFFDKKFDAPAALGNDAVMTAANNTVRGNAYTGPRSAAPVRYDMPDPFTRIAGLMGADSNASILRISGEANPDSALRDWQIFPPSLYGKLALSPAQLMMLDDFTA
jgi:hypothetical protein